MNGEYIECHYKYIHTLGLELFSHPIYIVHVHVKPAKN
jgi:hypothetical protein